MACCKCKNKTRDSANFCDNCGTRLEKNKIDLNVLIVSAVCFIAFLIVIIGIVSAAQLSNQSQQNVAPAYDKALFIPLLKQQNWTIPYLGTKLVYVAPNTFKMGSKNGELDEKPVHKVTISKAYWIGKYELTQREYQLIMGNNPSYYKDADKPVECVSWNDAAIFCEQLTQREHRARRLPAAYEYRLPTEAEWEYAARGGNKSKGYKYSGGDNIDSVAWYGYNSGRQTHKVGEKTANELGIHDMSGNVWEWCLDTCNKSGVVAGIITNTYKNGVIDPFSNNSYHIFRGGGWYRDDRLCRVTNRAGNSPDRKLYYLGFRIVLGQKLRKYFYKRKSLRFGKNRRKRSRRPPPPMRKPQRENFHFER